MLTTTVKSRFGNAVSGQTGRAGRTVYSSIVRYALTAGFVAAATIVRLLIEPKVYTPYLPFLLAVMAAAHFLGLGAGLAASGLSAIAIDYLFMPPSFSLRLQEPADVGSLVEFAIVCVILNVLIHRLHRELASARLRERELDQQMQLIELSRDAIIILDPQRRIQGWNAGAAELYGWTKKEAAGRTIGSLLQSTGKRPMEEIREEIVRQGRWEGELRQVARDGREIIADSRHVLLRDDKGAPTAWLEINRDVTERKRSAEALERSVQRFRQIFESSPMGIGIADWSGRFEQCNPALCALLGYAEGELQQMHYASLIPQDEFAASMAQREKLRAGEIAYHEREGHYIRKNGELIWIHKFVSTLPDQDGGPSHILVLVTDISDRKRAEQAILQRERDLRRFTEAAPVAIAMFDCDMRYVATSQRFRDDLGLGEQELEGRSHYELFPEIPERWREIHRRCLAGATERNPGEMWLRADGSEQWTRWEIQPWRRSGSEIGGIVLFTEDITQQKHTEKARDAAEEQLRRALESRRLAMEAAELGAWDYRFTTGELFWDPRSWAIFGVAEDASIAYREAIGRIHEEDRRGVSEAVTKALQGKPSGVFHQEFRVVWQDGSIHWVAAHGRAFFDPQGRALRMLGVNTDITQRKRAEQEIREMNASLERRVEERTVQLRETNQELEAFCYSVSHDLRAPLRGIDGWSLALMEDHGGQLNADARRQLDRVRTETQRMGLLIDDLLQLSRITRREMQVQDVDLTDLARLVSGRLLEQNKGRHIEVSIEPGMKTRGDRGLIEILLTNLLGNAVKFTAPRDPARIEVGRDHGCNQSTFFVRDNGVGFNMAYAAKLFGAFQRLHKASEFPGTGIGLATVERIARRHGGRVWAHAEVNRGATFHFNLEEAYAAQRNSAGGR